MQVSALFKKAAPAPAKTVKKEASKTVKKFGFPGKKAAPPPPPAKKKFGFPGKKAAAPPPAKKAAPKKAAPKAAPKKAAPKKAAPKKSSGGPSKAAAPQNLAKWYGPDRAKYLPGGLLEPQDIPDYLNGTLAGDYGFDPLGLGKDGNVDKYREYELIHARWAMLGVAGVVFPEALGVKGGVWFETGKVLLDGEQLTWSAPPFASEVPNVLPLPAVVAIQVVLMGFVEKYRTEGAGPGGFAPTIGNFDESAFNGLDKLNPGGPLDFFNVASTPEDLKILQVKEIKNGRLAMVAMLACFVQGPVTGEGPFTNWAKHVQDPFGYNFVTVSAVERLPTL